MNCKVKDCNKLTSDLKKNYCALHFAQLTAWKPVPKCSTCKVLLKQNSTTHAFKCSNPLHTEKICGNCEKKITSKDPQASCCDQCHQKNLNNLPKVH